MYFFLFYKCIFFSSSSSFCCWRKLRYGLAPSVPHFINFLLYETFYKGLLNYYFYFIFFIFLYFFLAMKVRCFSLSWNVFSSFALIYILKRKRKKCCKFHLAWFIINILITLFSNSNIFRVDDEVCFGSFERAGKTIYRLI